MLYLGVAVAVGVALVLVVVLVGPALTGSSSGSVSADLTYSGAHPVADRAVGGFGGGGWTLLFAAGLVSPTAETISVNATDLGELDSYCTVTTESAFTGLSLPAYSGNRSSGAAPAWVFAYRNGTGDIAIVTVIDGQGTVVATLSGLACELASQLYFRAVPGNAIDSSQAAADVLPAAKTFLTAHPNASAAYALIGGAHYENLSLPTEWSITYSTCSLNTSATGTGAEFNATVNATTGEVIRTASTAGVSCGSESVTSSDQLNTSFDLGAQTISGTEPDQNYSWPVIFAENGITWDNLSATVEPEDAEGSLPVDSGWTLTARTAEGATIATFDPGLGKWSGSATQPIAVGDDLVVSTTMDLGGDVLLLTGEGSFVGSQPWLL